MKYPQEAIVSRLRKLEKQQQPATTTTIVRVGGGGTPSTPQVQADWNELDTTKPDYIQNKPNNALLWVPAPVASDAPGTAGEVAYDDAYFYVCVATNRWGRVLLDFWTVGGYGIGPMGANGYGG